MNSLVPKVKFKIQTLKTVHLGDTLFKLLAFVSVRETERKMVLQKVKKSGYCLNRFHCFNKTIYWQHAYHWFCLGDHSSQRKNFWLSTLQNMAGYYSITIEIHSFSTQFRQNWILFIFEVFHVVVRIRKIVMQFFLSWWINNFFNIFYFYTLKYI